MSPHIGVVTIIKRYSCFHDVPASCEVGLFFFFLVARGTRLCSLESPSPKILLREGNLFFGALFEIEIKYSEIQENDFQLLQTRMHTPPTHSQDHLLFEKSLLVFSRFFFCLFVF